MKIKYIVDISDEGKFIFIDTRSSAQFEITNKGALDLMHGAAADETFFSYRADVALRSVSQEEVS